MATIIPTTGAQWSVARAGSFEGLEFNVQAPVSPPSDHEVVVKFHAASLNYRDLIIALGTYPFPLTPGIVPGSDGAGEVIAVGSKVTRFAVGARVATLFTQTHLSGDITVKQSGAGLGANLNGTLRQYGTFNENGLVSLPPNLSYNEGATLSCAAVTAWNSLYGLKTLQPGDFVLTQGTGGVSIFALQLAKAAGAKVISTTSSKAKEEILKSLGADLVLNYKDVENWGAKAKEFTGGDGVDYIIEVGGQATLKQSLAAIRFGGIISLIGFLSTEKPEDQPLLIEAMMNQCIVRGILVGSRDQFEDMNRAIEANDINPVIDKKIFKLDNLKEAYQYAWDQKHIGKVVIEIA